MTPVTVPHPLERFAVSPAQAFDALNDPAQGIAYVPVEGADPQGLVDRMARWAFRSGTREGLIYKGGPEQGPPLYFVYQAVVAAIDRTIRQILPEQGADGRFLQAFPEVSLTLLAPPDTAGSVGRVHTDEATVITAYWGANIASHVIYPPGEAPLRVGRLAPSRVLLTRQDDWGMVGDADVEPISHKVIWQPAQEPPLRVVGLSFGLYSQIGPQDILPTKRGPT